MTRVVTPSSSSFSLKVVTNLPTFPFLQLLRSGTTWSLLTRCAHTWMEGASYRLSVASYSYYL